MNIPKHLLRPSPPFVESYDRHVAAASGRLARSKVAFVGLARNCGLSLRQNLLRVGQITSRCWEWACHIESNDCTDDTVEVLAEFAAKHRQITFGYQVLGREQFSTEFAGRRTEALAEYRTACQRWVRDCAADSDYVVVVDLDAWGGWSADGFLNGISWLMELPDAYGMASVSLLQHPAYETNASGETRPIDVWLHYDCWALRLNSYWDDYTAGVGAWKHHWLPPVGSPPVPVCSAMGGLCIYRTDAYLAGTYDGADCEHVPFHESIAKATGLGLYLNPSQRCVMRWQTHGG